MKRLLLLATTSFCFLNLIHAQPGHLDSSFGDHGIIKTDLGKSYSYNSPPVNKIIPQPGGSMFITLGTILSKRKSNGSIDESFGVKGYSADAGFTINDAAIQPDGKIVVVGSVRINNGDPTIYQSSYALARYNANGTLDRSFSGDGKLTTDLDTVKRAENEDDYESYDEAFSVAVQNDGKIVAAGHSNNHLSAARYNNDGSLDNTFDKRGFIINPASNYVSHTSIAIQKDGKLVIAGNSLMVRYNADGSRDNTFNGNGLSAFTGFLSIVIQDDSKIVLSGYASNNSGAVGAIGRLNTDGSLDSSFSDDGIQPTDFLAYSLALQTDGKVVTVGNTSTVDSATGAETYYFAVARYNNDGSADQTFSGDGKQTTSVGTGYTRGAAIAIQVDGKIVVGGQSFPYASLIRYNTNGSLDKSFDEDGKVLDLFYAGNSVFKKVVAQKDGKIVAGGSTWNGSQFVFAIVRYNADGSLDKTFSDDGIQTTAFTYHAYASSIAIEKNGKIVAAGGYYIARYNADGSLDSTFSNDGKQATDSLIYISAVTVQNDGKIVTAGGKYSEDEYGFNVVYPAVARYNTDGSLDKTFGKNGTQTMNSLDEGAFLSVAVQNDGKIAAAGITDDDGLYDGSVILVRLTASGSIDSAFGYKGTAYVSIGGNSCDLALQSDGKILVAGSGDDHDTGNTDVKRLNSDGTIDNSFQGSGAFEYYKSTDNTTLAIQNDGKIVVSGIELFRLNTDGSKDTAFNTGAAEEVDFEINNIAVSNNKLYAAGGGYYAKLAKYLLDNSNTPPTVSITNSVDNQAIVGPLNLHLKAVAIDTDGTITKVEFYNDSTLMHTETLVPYGYTWKHIPFGSYTVTAKAYDNSGNVTTSAPVHFTVAPNTPPAVSIISPANNSTYADTATIQLVASAADTDGRITRVEFYKDSTLLRTEYKYPYTYSWKNVTAGTYTITAVATDNYGAHITSAPITVTVISANEIVSSKPYSQNKKTALNDALSVRAFPNPATQILQITTQGLQANKPVTISIISNAGIVHKNIQISKSAQTMQLDVSSLSKGVYTIKIISGDKVLYKQFVKL